MQNKMKPNSPETTRTFNIILSIVIALSLWAYVIEEINPTAQQTIANVPVQLLNIQSLTARELAISGDAEYSVDVIVEGKRADIMKVTAQDIVAEADLFGWSKGENFIPVNVAVPQALKIVEIKSAKIQVTIEDLIALSKSLVLVYKGDMPEKSEVGAVVIKPSEVEVTGAKSDVETVTQVQVVIEIADLSAEGNSVQGVAVPVNYAGMPVENVKLSTNYIDIFAKLYKLKEVPLVAEFTGELPEGYGAEVDVPSTILIKGSKTALENIESISTELVDISGMTADGSIALTVILPEGVELANGYHNITAGVSIQETIIKVFQYNAEEILLEGLTKGKSVNTDATIIEVTVTGRKEVMSQLTADQLELYIDVTDLEPGYQPVMVMVSHELQLHNITVNPQEIDITLTQTQ